MDTLFDMYSFSINSKYKQYISFLFIKDFAVYLLKMCPLFAPFNVAHFKHIAFLFPFFTLSVKIYPYFTPIRGVACIPF